VSLEGEILIVTGPPGAGKSTMARALVEEFALAVLLQGDWYFERVVRGWIEPWKPPSQHQNAVVTRAMAASAREYARGGYAVVLEGIIGPWFLDTFVPGAGDAPALVDPEPIEKMYREFARLGAHEHHVVDTSGHSVEQTVAEVLARLEAGDLRL